MFYCIYCMKENHEDSAVCPYCGKRQKDYICPPHVLRPGTIVGEKYLIGAMMAEGGFGITYIGLDTMLLYRVAIKEFYPNGLVNRAVTSSTTVSELFSDDSHEAFEKFKSGFLNEARLLARFSNESGIVSVRDIFESNGTAYMIMEFLDGIDLRTYLKQKGNLSYGETFEMMLPVMRSLERIHNEKLIHRDISPENIMLIDGNIKLIDFGAARGFADEKSLSIILKPGYAPLEQYSTRGKQGSWTDVYSLSATMYHCITGVVPISAPDRAVTCEEPPRPSELGIEIPKAFEDTLMKGLELKAENRIQTVWELETMLMNSLTDDPKNSQAPKPDNTYEHETKSEQKTSSSNTPAERKKSIARYFIPSAAAIVLVLGVIIAVNKFTNKTDRSVTLPTEEITTTNTFRETAATTIKTTTSGITTANPVTTTEIITTTTPVTTTATPITTTTTSAEKPKGSDSSVHKIDSIKWKIDSEGVLTISGKGDLKYGGYKEKEVPWKSRAAEIKKVIIKKGITSIGYSLFNDADYDNLKSMSIPESVVNINGNTYDSFGEDGYSRPFGNTPNLINVKVDKNNKIFYTVDGVLFQKYKANNSSRETDLLLWYPAGKTDKIYNIPDGVHAIWFGAFEGCQNLSSVNIPNSVKVIAFFAFTRCSALKSIEIPDSVTFTSMDTFSHCTALTDVKLPNTITKIGEYDFFHCINLKSITIPASVTEIGEKAFGYYDEGDLNYVKKTPRNRGIKRGIRITAHTSPKTVRRVHFIKLTAFSYQPNKDSPMRISYKI